MMLDWLNPNVGTHTFSFDESSFEENVHTKLSRIRDKMDTTSARLKHTETILADQDGEFVKSLLERLNDLVTASEVKNVSIHTASLLHSATFTDNIADYHKQKYDIHTELDQEALKLTLK